MEQKTFYGVITSVIKLKKKNQFGEHIASRFNLVCTDRNDPRDGA